MDFNETLQTLLELDIALPKVRTPQDQQKLLDVIKNKNLELKAKKKVLKYDSKTGKATIAPRTNIDNQIDVALNKIR
jgi:hypothetical protein